MRARDAGAVRDALLAGLPTGPAWSRRPSSVRTRLLGVVGEGIAPLEADLQRLLAEVAGPRGASSLLADFERVLGPDPCGRDQDALGIDDRRRIAHQRWTAGGGASIAYFVGLAAKLGIPATIEERQPSRAGRMRAGHRVIPAEGIFAWRVHLPATVVRKFIAGRSRAGHRLGAIVPSAVECPIRRLAPAHTVPVFSYEGSP